MQGTRGELTGDLSVPRGLTESQRADDGHRWTTTPDCDSTGSYWIGMLWLAAAAPDEILAYLRGQRAAYKLPTSVEVIAAIPKTGSGKIRRVGLRDRAAAKEE